jgi:Phosphatidylglycerophosphate synthase
MLFAASTDMLDGYLARKLNQVTEVGKIIDPLADKAAMALIVIKLYLIGEISGFFSIL